MQQVILTKDVDTLGSVGDVIKVTEGMALNYLFPRGAAVRATKGALKDRDGCSARIKAKAEKKYQEDLAKAEKITTLIELTLEANAGDTGKLYGTITTKELAQLLHEKTGLDIERRNLNLDHPINKIGEYVLHVKISARVSAELKINVKAIKSSHEAFLLEEAFDGEEVTES